MVWDERIERNLRKQQDYSDGFDDGKELGIEEGIRKNKRDMIINLNKNGVSLEIISKSTGLTIEEIKDIIKSNH